VGILTKSSCLDRGHLNDQVVRIPCDSPNGPRFELVGFGVALDDHLRFRRYHVIDGAPAQKGLDRLADLFELDRPRTRSPQRTSPATALSGLNDQSNEPAALLARDAVKRIDAIFAIEREINGRSIDDRLAGVPRTRCALVADFETGMRAQHGKLSRHSDVGKAILKCWETFTRFLNDDRICLTSNAAERALRGVAPAGCCHAAVFTVRIQRCPCSRGVLKGKRTPRGRGRHG
jgi:hypothetical protein